MARQSFDNPIPPATRKSAHERTSGEGNEKLPDRDEIKKGSAVWIIEKEHYGTDRYTQGIVDEILTPHSSHPRGIKVRLTDGTVGRVQWLM